MFDTSPLKRLLILLSTVSTGFAIVVCSALLLARQFNPAPVDAAEQSIAATPAVAAAARSGAVVLPTAALAIQSRFDGQIKPLLNQYCGNCHLGGKDKGDVRLDQFDTIESVQKDAQTWRYVADVVHGKVMPPENKPQPTDAERELLKTWIKEALDHCDCSGPRDPGRVTVRRLNRNEYNNTVRDLLGVTDFKPADDFPADDTGYGFDNIADVLTMSPLLAEKYLAAAEQVLEKSVVTAEPPKPRVIKYDGAQMEVTRGGGNNGPGGSRRLLSEGEVFQLVTFPAEAQYEIRVAAGAEQAGDEPAKVRVTLDGQELQTFDVTTGPRRPETFKVSTRVGAGEHRVAAAFVNDFYDPRQPDHRKRDRNLVVHRVEVEGPLDLPPPEPTAVQKQVFFVKPGQDGLSEEQAAFKVLQRFATRAYRRPASDEEISRLLELFKLARAQGDGFEKAAAVSMSAVLVSPSFLFRIEQERSTDPSQPYAIDDYELASRLSYFLWSSTPDDELLAKAAAGRLREPDALKAEVRRMLVDPRSAALVSNFTGQWLQLRNLDRQAVDRKTFPNYTDELRADMRREAELFFQNLIREDRPVLDLLNADYTFVNERLARHYGIAGVRGEDFRRVSLAGTHRGGVLTMGGVLTVTAMPTRTSPVKRGKFILDQILGMPPAPPPPDVTPLGDKPQDVSAGSLRQRLERHREDPSCFSCHARMDPLGFAMERFDAVGAWRDQDGGFPIDAAGKLPEGREFNGPDELRQVLLEHKTEFLRCFVENMLTYALGRGVEHYDRCTVRDICQSVETDGYRFGTLVTSIVTSDAFQKRRAKRGDE